MSTDTCPVCGRDMEPAGRLLGSGAAAMRIHLTTHLSDILQEFADFVFKTALRFDDPDLTDKERDDFKREIRAVQEKYRDVQVAFNTRPL